MGYLTSSTDHFATMRLSAAKQELGKVRASCLS
jgi:hypothetical protein